MRNPASRVVIESSRAPTTIVERANLPAEAFRKSNRWFARVMAGLRAIHQGFWLGALDREALHHVVEREYSANERYLASYHNLLGLFPWEEQVLDRFFGGCRSVLLGAAGGGREIIALSRRGIQVDAFEPCQQLLEVCQHLLANERVGAKVVKSPPDRVPEGFGVYDGLIMGWTGYSHILGRATRVRFLAEFHRHVRPNGPILLSFVTRRPESLAHRWIFHVARFIRFLRRSREMVEPGDALSDAYFHFFTKDEIRRELEDSGYHLEYYSEAGFGHAVGKAKDLAET